MSKIEEIERAVEQLPLPEFIKLAEWMELRLRGLAVGPSVAISPLRDHSAFLSGYAPEDEGLYDDAAGG